MGYYIKFLPNKKSNPKWKVQYISWKQEDTKSSNAKKPKREWDISKDRWHSLGFVSSMNLNEAKSRARAPQLGQNPRFLQELITDLVKLGKSAKVFAGADQIVAELVQKTKAGDVVLIMSNGGFDGIYTKLMTQLFSTLIKKCATLQYF